METKEKKKSLPRLTKKRQGFVKDYIATGENGAEAARRNFNVKNDNTARAVASELLTFPNVQQALEIERKSLRDALEQEGVTPQKIAQKVNVLLDAEDANSIDKGLKHATAIYGVEPDAPKNPSGNTYINIFAPNVQEKVKAIEAEIKQALIQPKHVGEA